MKNFMDENFLLQTETAQKLYHEHAAKMPIIDYHCHLIPRMVADDYKFKSLTEIWLGGDHYKWRAMRTLGIHESFITGDASYHDKFLAFAAVLPVPVWSRQLPVFPEQRPPAAAHRKLLPLSWSYAAPFP